MLDQIMEMCARRLLTLQLRVLSTATLDPMDARWAVMTKQDSTTKQQRSEALHQTA